MPVLEDFSMYIKPFETTFVVGQSGSGKSTISALLLRLYDVDYGEIFVDDNRLQTISPHWLFENIHVVEQQAVLFGTSIAENIRLGRKKNPSSVTEKEIRRACEVAFVDEFLDSLPHGLETQVGQGGSKLSGGQKQRVALARAYISDAPIMIFDESVSALDVKLRERAIESIKQFRKGKTTVIITHELSQIGPEDEVYLVNEGRVVEYGKRNELEFKSSGQLRELIQATAISPTGSTMEPLPEVVPRQKRHTLSIYSQSSAFRPSSIVANGTYIYDPTHSIYIGDDEDFQHFELERENPRPKTVMQKLGLRKAKQYDEEETIGNGKDNKQIPTKEFLRAVYKSIPDKKLLIFGILVSVLNGLSNPLFAFAFSHLITAIVPDMATSGNDESSVDTLQWALIVLALAGVDGITTYLKLSLDIVAERWLFMIRQTALNNILFQDMQWFFADEKNKSGSLNNLLMNQLEDIRMVVTRFLPAIASILSLAICAISWAFAAGWKLTLVGLSLLPGFYITSSWYKKICQKWETKYQENSDKTVDLMNEIVSGIKTTKTLAMESYFLKQFNEKQSRALDIGFRKAIYVGLGFGISQLFTYITQGLLLWYGMKLISTGEYTTQQTMLVFTLLVFSLVTAEQVFSTIPQITNGIEVFWRSINLVHLDTDDTQENQGENLPLMVPLRGDIQLEHVKFGYGRQDWLLGRDNVEKPLILKDCNINIERNEVIALIGPSGCGKSTIANILTKLYQPERGKIRTDGADIRDINTADLRKQVTIVHQMPIKFFDGTIEENLLYAIEDKTSYSARELDLLMKEACEECGIHGFISTRLAEGYRTQISSTTGGGSPLLSGGQLQRLGIARALMRKPKILILDECTSALDPESISIIIQMISRHKRARDMTIVIITHQEQVTHVADRIINIGN